MYLIVVRIILVINGKWLTVPGTKQVLNKCQLSSLTKSKAMVSINHYFPQCINNEQPGFQNLTTEMSQGESGHCCPDFCDFPLLPRKPLKILPEVQVVEPDLSWYPDHILSFSPTLCSASRPMELRAQTSYGLSTGHQGAPLWPR